MQRNRPGGHCVGGSEQWALRVAEWKLLIMSLVVIAECGDWNDCAVPSATQNNQCQSSNAAAKHCRSQQQQLSEQSGCGVLETQLVVAVTALGNRELNELIRWSQCQLMRASV